MPASTPPRAADASQHAAEQTHPDFHRYLDAQRADGRFRPPQDALTAGQTTDPIRLTPNDLPALAATAARQAAGFFRPTRRTEIVWVRGQSQLAVGIVDIAIKTGSGLVAITLPVRCDQTGPATVEVVFAVGADDAPAGLIAATQRRPQGPAVIVAAWGENLVAFAWQCLLGIATGISGAAGKDSRGNLLVPVELVAGADGLVVHPMARFRFAGASGLTTSVRR